MTIATHADTRRDSHKRNPMTLARQRIKDLGATMERCEIVRILENQWELPKRLAAGL